ncbi:MAG: DUF1697 domain-containing protein [Vicingus serpentipes]|nr:DUF1697 domain-containing protein [Vicingus serpentipes]
MKTYISILRGINVSGQKKIKMADLKLLYEELGFKNIKTYIQSGNVVFDYQIMSASALQQLIFDKIQEHYGFDVPNLILTPQEIKEALNNNPFKDIEKMYFTFLAELPEQEDVQKLVTFNFSNEFYEINKKVIYFHCPDGYGRAKMNNNFFEQQLKVVATTRNLNTVKKLSEIVSTQF